MDMKIGFVDCQGAVGLELMNLFWFGILAGTEESAAFLSLTLTV